MNRSRATTWLLACSVCGSAAADWSAEAILEDSGLRGGLIVRIGCGDGQWLADLRGGDAFLVQGLDTDPAAVERARRHCQSLGLCGPVSAVVFDGRKLPYADNLVNLVVAEDLGEVAMPEVLRALRPGGAAIVRRGDEWTKTVKPWPSALDQWTHYLHGADNNAVSADTAVGPPQHFQWISGPRFSRSHDHLASVSAVVSAGGRLFSIVDEGSIAFAAARARWRLIARDAFNGIRLWEREIPEWEQHLRDFRSGPADIARRLVAVGDRVYVTLGYGQPVTALDAATGETVRRYAGTEGAREIVCDEGLLLLVLGEDDRDWPAERARQIVSQPDYAPPFETVSSPARELQLVAVNADSGERVWKAAETATRSLLPSTLAVSGGRVVFHNLDALVCLDARTGGLRWQVPRRVQRQRLAWSTPTVVIHEGLVFAADRSAANAEGELLWIPSGGYHQYIQGEDARGELVALDAETGRQLWSCPAYEGFNAPVDILIADGLLWTGRYAWGQDPGITEGRDLRTGEVRRQRSSDLDFLPKIGHARCHRAKATSRFLVLGRRGVEFVDLDGGGMVANFWLRGVCQYGVMPANGLLYVPPHSCACNVEDMLKCGFMALAPSSSEAASEPPAPAELVRGPAYGFVSPSRGQAEDDDWPAYRRDAARSGAGPASVPARLVVAWQTELGGQLTPPVIAEGVLVAAAEAHQVHAIDAATGQKLWSHVAGGRIDSPPAIERGRVFFGAADGWVSCLRLADGETIWRFRAAPGERQIVADGQLESAWPVSGSVLVDGGSVYFVAGRTSYLDGGMLLYKLDAASGAVLNAVRLDVEPAKRDGGFASGGYLPDLLSASGEGIFLRAARFDRDLARQQDNVAHLWSSVGFLDDSWWHRTYWQYGTTMGSGWGGWPKAGQQVPAGRLLVTDGKRIFGFGRSQYDVPGAHVGIDAGGVWGPIGQGQSRWTWYRLFGGRLDAADGRAARRGTAAETASDSSWSRRIPVLGQAMVLAGSTLFIAGPQDPAREIPQSPTATDPLAEAIASVDGGCLLAVSPDDGSTLAELDLSSPPVFDGMAAAKGRLYLVNRKGSVVCLSSPGTDGR